MNIIIMHTHDTGRYIEPYGYEFKTPNLMKLAKRGTVLRNAYCAGPTCSPSRAAMLTGMSPHSSGMLGLAHRGFNLSRPKEHLANFLKGQGYETALFGIQHECEATKIKETLGYDIISTHDYCLESTEEDLNQAKLVAEYIESTKRAPFFLSFGMFNTHRPFPPAKGEFDENYLRPPSCNADTPEVRADMAQFATSLKCVDDCVGTVLDAIERAGIIEDTLIVFTTDHGVAFPHMKCNLYDDGIGISLILSCPFKTPKVIDALVSHIDLFPTICDLAGLEKPDYLQGNSLKPLLYSETTTVRNEIFSEVTYHAAYEPMRCIRTTRYKLIRFFDTYKSLVLVNTDDSPSRRFLIENGWKVYRGKEDMLFDLYLDPLERINLIQDENYSNILDDLSKRLDKWMAETNDPLLLGSVPLPPGAFADGLDALNPSKLNPSIVNV